MKFFDSTQKAYRQQRSTFRNIRTFPRNIKTFIVFGLRFIVFGLYCFWPIYPLSNSKQLFMDGYWMAMATKRLVCLNIY